MKRVLTLLLCVFMMVIIFSGCTASSKTDWEYIAQKGEMVIGITSFAPMNYKDSNGQWTGFETEVAEAVCKKLGVTCKFSEIKWDKKLLNLKEKSIDCVWNGMTITDEIKANADVSIPYMRNRQTMIVKKENSEKYLTPESLNGITVIAETKSAGETVATTEDFFKQAKYISVDSQAKVLMELKAGTADVGVIDYVMSIGSIGEGTSYDDLVAVTQKEFAPEEYGIAVRKDSPETTKKINEALVELSNDGTLESIASKYKLSELLTVKAQ